VKIGGRRRWWVSAAAVVVAVVIGAWLLVSDVALPRERYSSAPDPCALLATETVRELIGTAAGRRTDPDEEPYEPFLGRASQVKQCSWRADPDDDYSGVVDVMVQVSFGTKFGLGMSGAEKVEALSSKGRCDRWSGLDQEVYERSNERGYVCAKGGSGLSLEVVSGNALVVLHASPQQPIASGEVPWEPIGKAAELADEILSRLTASAS
jgi:hypothetical protein